jgi:hypothetical protein
MLVTLSAALISARAKNRSNFIVYPFMIAAIGYIGLLALPHPNLPGVTYGMLFVVAGGLYPTICGILSWNGKSKRRLWSKHLANKEQQTISLDLGSAPSAWVYRSVREI